MSLIWLTTSFGYYLIFSLISTFDYVYLSAMTSSISEMIAYVLSGILYERIGVKLSLILSFTISTVGGVLILVWGLDHQDSVLFFIFFLLTKFGITFCFNINFAANSYFFPTLFASTALGVCSFLARGASAFSFVVGEMDEPVPMYLFTGLCMLSIIAAFFLRLKDTKKPASQDESKKLAVIEEEEEI